MERGAHRTVAPQIVSITPGGSPVGYLPLSIFGIDPIPGVGDETLVNFSVPAFTYGSEVYTQIGMVSNGYAVENLAAARPTTSASCRKRSPTRSLRTTSSAPYWTEFLEPS